MWLETQTIRYRQSITLLTVWRPIPEDEPVMRAVRPTRLRETGRAFANAANDMVALLQRVTAAKEEEEEATVGLTRTAGGTRERQGSRISGRPTSYTAQAIRRNELAGEGR
jgi:hypothetical protein